ncbi:MAG: holo-ACP synthase [Candidatus Lightella neohaematopini]|nr:holo-ACP synthase [Candidatus Lightella neohaematopini]MCV2524877.1 holo-ACP synthase [Candidatus Lightella neohaematopini]
MQIIGIGIDIIEIKRIKLLLFRKGNLFPVKILHKNELLRYYNNNNPIRFLATRFAVKEAALKAFGTGIHNGLYFNQFEVINNSYGKPLLVLFGQAKILANNLSINNIHVSLTDEKNYACALVILEGNNINKNKLISY